MDASSSIGDDRTLGLVMNFVTRIFHTFSVVGDVRYGLVVFGDSVKVPYRYISFNYCIDVSFLISIHLIIH